MNPNDARGSRALVTVAVLGVLAIVVGYGAGRLARGAGLAPGSDPVVAPTSGPAANFDRPSHPLIGQPAPDWSLTRLDSGETVTLAEFAGQPVLINFWATWCPPCRFEMPWLQAAHERHADAGLVVLGVNAGERVPPANEPLTIANYVRAAGLTFPVLHGSDAGPMQAAYDVWGLPATFLVGRDGRVAAAQIGMYPSAEALEADIATVLETVLE